jgi:hypothetical protein
MQCRAVVVVAVVQVLEDARRVANIWGRGDDGDPWSGKRMLTGIAVS